jgi:flagellar hook-basal body complex protein FliE
LRNTSFTSFGYRNEMMMRVDPLVPDVAQDAPVVTALPVSDGGSFGDLVDAAGAVLGQADDAERAFAAHRGGLQEMVVERARADIALQIAAAGTQRVTQGLQTILGMQI